MAPINRAEDKTAVRVLMRPYFAKTRTNKVRTAPETKRNMGESTIVLLISIIM